MKGKPFRLAIKGQSNWPPEDVEMQIVFICELHLVMLFCQENKIQTQKGSKERLLHFIITRTHNMHIFGEIPSQATKQHINNS